MNYPSEPVGTALLVALALGYGLAVLGWRGLLEHPVESPRRLAFAGLMITAFMLPMLSNDVFSLFAYGSVAARGHDVYTSAAALPQSVWFPWIGERWAGQRLRLRPHDARRDPAVRPRRREPLARAARRPCRLARADGDRDGALFPEAFGSAPSSTPWSG